MHKNSNGVSFRIIFIKKAEDTAYLLTNYFEIIPLRRSLCEHDNDATTIKAQDICDFEKTTKKTLTQVISKSRRGFFVALYSSSPSLIFPV